jgi:hypothetical protein
LSCPVGFKNGTDGKVRIAVDAVKAAAQPHHFMAVTKDGQSAIASTSGNGDCHVILRGGHVPNYQPADVEAACRPLEAAGLQRCVMIDASHANSGYDPANQPAVVDAVAEQVGAGNHCIIGVMIESNLVGGRQTHVPGRPLCYGQSITDGCVDWEIAVEMLGDAGPRRNPAPANAGHPACRCMMRPAGQVTSLPGSQLETHPKADLPLHGPGVGLPRAPRAPRRDSTTSPRHGNPSGFHRNDPHEKKTGMGLAGGWAFYQWRGQFPASDCSIEVHGPIPLQACSRSLRRRRDRFWRAADQGDDLAAWWISFAVTACLTAWMTLRHASFRCSHRIAGTFRSRCCFPCDRPR